MPPKAKSNLEAVQKHRAKVKADRELHEAYLAKERERYQKRKEQGKIQNINDLSARGQRSLQNKWKKDKRKQRQQKKEAESFATPVTPQGTTPATLDVEVDVHAVNTTTHQKKAGRKKVRREQRKAYRTIESQKEKVQELQREVKKLRKRLKNQSNKTNRSGEQAVSTSPATKVNCLVNEGDSSKVKRALMFGAAVCEEIKTKMTEGRSAKEKRCIHNVICGQILKKYRLISAAKKVISLSNKRVRRVLSKTGFVSVFEHARKRKIGLGKTTELVKEFFLQDENSAPSSGVRETVTRNKIKMQKRYLTDSLLNLHAKFRAEHSSEKISYTTFTRLRPFYCVYPSVNSRDTVKCKLHANIELKVNRLHQLGYLSTGDVTKLVPEMVCSSKTYNCMYGICEKCKCKVNDLVAAGKTILDTVAYEEWSQVKEQRVTSKGPISVSMMTKVTVSDTVANLCEAFAKVMRLFLPHQYRIIHQYQAMRDIKNKIGPNECVLQIDYSENYNCKAAVEVQGMHFGASRRQVSLHTCHCTFKKSTGEHYTKCFCTLSDDSRHGPSAVWAHLHPVLMELKNMGIEIVHFISDGPTTQYRNKTNFLLMSTLPFEKYRFKFVYWNLLESSHGKGPADGVGAAVKSAADNLVAHGQDILDVKKLYDSLNDTINVKLFMISSDDINNIEKIVNGIDHDTVKGTMQIHQLVAPKYGNISHRKLSCYCEYNAPAKDACHCHSLATVTVTSHDLDEPGKKRAARKRAPRKALSRNTKSGKKS